MPARPPLHWPRLAAARERRPPLPPPCSSRVRRGRRAGVQRAGHERGRRAVLLPRRPLYCPLCPGPRLLGRQGVVDLCAGARSRGRCCGRPWAPLPHPGSTAAPRKLLCAAAACCTAADAAHPPSPAALPAHARLQIPLYASYMALIHVVLPWWSTPKLDDMPETGEWMYGRGSAAHARLPAAAACAQQTYGAPGKAPAAAHPVRPPTRLLCSADAERKRREKRERQETRAAKFRRG